jgi:hypothetical protein
VRDEGGLAEPWAVVPGKGRFSVEQCNEWLVVQTGRRTVVTTDQERMQILKMIESGRVTAEEGAKLLGAIHEATAREQSEAEEAAPRWFRVRVTDMHTGRNKVSVNIPFDLVNVGIRMGARFAPGKGDIAKEVSDAVNQGLRGKIIEVEDEDKGERVSIYVE